MRTTILLLSLLLLTACATTAPAPIDLARAEVVDLTYSLDDKTLYWPSTEGSGFQLQKLAYGHTEGGYFYSSNAFCTPEHGGTHLDAPIHFGENRRTVDNVPVRQLIAPAAMIDVSAKAANNADYRLTVEDVTEWEARHGAIAPGTIVVLRTGWGPRWGDRLRYFGDDRPGKTDNLHFPSYGTEAARLLVEQRKVGALGVDTASIDYGQSHDFMVHRIAAAAEVPGLENVANVDRLPERGAWIVALPVKIGGGSGGPVRIVTILP
jgi:kynurenine formamidase